ncbi:MAG: CoA-binding protein, partial [Bacteroidota bacterium]|nr:CoA-binding protein [Bacteroidota bacterium]
MRTVCEILKDSKNIAVYGLSDKPGRISRDIALFLKRKGFNVVGVNPLAKSNEVDGITIYGSLKDVPFEIDIVDVFRRPEAIPEIIDDVMAIRPKVLWLQSGIRNDQAVAPVIELGI